MCTCFHCDWLFIEIQKRRFETGKTLEDVYLLKVSNKNTTGIIESYSKWNVWPCIRVPIDIFEKVSQITLACLLHTLSFYCMQSVPFYSALFL